MFQKESMWIQCTTVRSFTSWKLSSVTSSPVWEMSRFSLYMIIPTPTFSWVYDGIPWLAWLVYFFTSSLFAWSSTQWFLVIPVLQRFPGWSTFCKWFTGEISGCKIFPWLSDELLCYRNWTSCRSIQKMSQFW